MTKISLIIYLQKAFYNIYIKIRYNALAFTYEKGSLYIIKRIKNTYQLIYQGSDYEIKSKSYKSINTRITINTTNWNDNKILLIMGIGINHFHSDNIIMKFRKYNNTSNTITIKTGDVIAKLVLLKII